MSQASSQKSNRLVITTSEDTAKLKLVEEQSALIDKQIEQQALEKAQLEAQAMLLKVQLIQTMQHLEMRLQQAAKLSINSQQQQKHHPMQADFEDEEVITPKRSEVVLSEGNMEDEEVAQRM